MSREDKVGVLNAHGAIECVIFAVCLRDAMARRRSLMGQGMQPWSPDELRELYDEARKGADALSEKYVRDE